MDSSTPILLIIFALACYLLPTFIAMGRKHKDAPAIIAVNIFFGWSVIGWFIAFIWSLSDPRGRGNQTVVVNTTQHVGPAMTGYAEPPPRRATFIDEQPRLSPSTPQTPLLSEDPDTRFWDNMKDKSNIDSLEEYLHRFPHGRFAQLATARLSRAGIEPVPSATLSPILLRAPVELATHCACGSPWENGSKFCSGCGSPREQDASL